MKTIEYIESEKVWHAPALGIKPCGLGEAILETLKNSDPDQVYEILHDSGTHVTRKEIHDQTITAAHNLMKLGVKKNDVVVFFTFFNLKTTPLTFACYTIGAAVCFFETYLEEKLVPEYLELLDPTVIIYQTKFKSMVFKGLRSASLLNLKHVLCLDDSRPNMNQVEKLIFRPKVDVEKFQIPKIPHPDYEAAILAFTSGSTGKPKIVMQSHSMIRQGVYSRWQVTPGSVIMILSEVRWQCQVTAMLQPAFLDVIRVYSSTPKAAVTGEFVREIIDTHKVTHYFEMPNVLITVLENAKWTKDPLSLSSLQLALVGGERINETSEEYLKTLMPKHCQLAKCYGMTETCGANTSSEMAHKKNINGGILQKGWSMKIIDSDKQLLGPNQMGTVCFKSSAPFLGYLKNQDSSANGFMTDGWLNTGDLGMVDSDNILHIFAREKYVLRHADGRILMPSVIENIVNEFDGVYSSILVGAPSDGQSKHDCGTVFVILNSKSDINENDFRVYLRKLLSEDQLEIVRYFKVIEDFPRTSCFKIDRLALKYMLDGHLKI